MERAPPSGESTTLLLATFHGETSENDWSVGSEALGSAEWHSYELWSFGRVVRRHGVQRCDSKVTAVPSLTIRVWYRAITASPKFGGRALLDCTMQREALGSEKNPEYFVFRTMSTSYVCLLLLNSMYVVDFGHLGPSLERLPAKITIASPPRRRVCGKPRFNIIARHLHHSSTASSHHSW
jgi:hypothetical protein